MVSNVRLAQIHLRLAEIFSTGPRSNKSFANLNIMLLGDLLQVFITSYIRFIVHEVQFNNLEFCLFSCNLLMIVIYSKI